MDRCVLVLSNFNKTFLHAVQLHLRSKKYNHFFLFCRYGDMRIGVAQLFSKQVNSLSKVDHHKLMRWLLHVFLKTTLVPNEFIRRTLLPILFSMLTISITVEPNENLEAGETLWMRFRKLFLSHMDALIVDKGLGDRDYCELYREECVMRITALYYCISLFKILLFQSIKMLPYNCSPYCTICISGSSLWWSPNPIPKFETRRVYSLSKVITFYALCLTNDKWPATALATFLILLHALMGNRPVLTLYRLALFICWYFKFHYYIRTLTSF